MGRHPFNWTDDVEQEILERIMGGDPISKICGSGRADFLPSESAFYRHLSKSSEFWEKYARAREAQAHREVEEIREIADGATNEDYNVARLKIDARKWRASKMAPKKYGDKLDLNHGSQPDDPISDFFKAIADGTGRIGS